MSVVLRWIHNLVGYPIFVAVTAALVGFGGLAQALRWRADPERRTALAAARWGWGYALWALQPLWRLHRSGLERVGEGPYLVVANHQSVLDIPAVLGLPLPLRIVARPGIFRVPVLGAWMRMSRQIPVAVGDAAALRAFATEVESSLKAGISVVVFPEGTRSPTGELAEFQRGAFRLALDLGVPVLPVAIDGTRFMLGKGRLGAERFPTPCGLIVRPPIAPGAAPNARKLAALAKAEIEAGVAEIRAQGWS